MQYLETILLKGSAEHAVWHAISKKKRKEKKRKDCIRYILHYAVSKHAILNSR